MNARTAGPSYLSRPSHRSRRHFFGALALAGLVASALAAAPPKQAAGIALERYVAIHAALAADTAAGVAETAAKLATEAEGFSRREKSKPLYQVLAKAAAGLQGSDLATLRKGLGALTAATDAVLRESGTQGWKLYYCPMAGGYWIQTREGVANPYYGKSMLTCGDVVAKIEVDE